MPRAAGGHPGLAGARGRLPSEGGLGHPVLAPLLQPPHPHPMPSPPSLSLLPRTSHSRAKAEAALTAAQKAQEEARIARITAKEFSPSFQHRENGESRCRWGKGSRGGAK